MLAVCLWGGERERELLLLIFHQFIYLTVFVNILPLQKVTPWNVLKLREAILNGPDCHPGARKYIDKVGTTILSTRKKERVPISRKLQSSRGALMETGEYNGNEGKVVLRHLRDGDVVLVNRQVMFQHPGLFYQWIEIRCWTFKHPDTCNIHFLVSTWGEKSSVYQKSHMKNRMLVCIPNKDRETNMLDFLRVHWHKYVLHVSVCSWLNKKHVCSLKWCFLLRICLRISMANCN